MDAASVLIAISVILILLLFTKKLYGSNIPGPIGLPIVGYLPFMTKMPYVKLAELRQKYGPIYRIQLGSRKIVVLCDYNIIKEAFSRDEFMGRPPGPLPFELTEETIRTGAVNDLQWKEQKRFALHRLRDLGFGKTRMEGHLKEEVEELLQRMVEASKSPLKVSDLLASSASNNISSFMFGKRMAYSDPKRQKLDHLFHNIGAYSGSLSLQVYFPWMTPIIKFFNIGNVKELSQSFTDLKEYINMEIKEHEKTLDPNNIRDFTDGYIMEIQKKGTEPNSSFSNDVLCDVAGAFYGAGSETIRIAVDWLLLLCATYPEIQKKVHQEIDTVLGEERFPSYEDRLNMPYTEACIFEMMRWRSPLPLNFLRYTLKDTELQGFFIPKHTTILAVPYTIDQDEKLWGKDLDVYKPERFLSKDGKKVVKPEYFIPFSIGKRSCPGKSLADIEVFIYFTAILQKFEFSLPPGKKADFEPELGIGLQPRRQPLCLKLRH